MHPDVTVLILTYDRTDLLSTCLKSVLKSNYKSFEVVISDNGSNEDIAGFVKNNFKSKKVRVVRKKKNAGLTGGFNFGFRYCRGKYVLLLSNDTKLHKNTLSEMVWMMDNDEKIGVVAGKIIQMKKPNTLHDAGSFLTWTGFLYHYGVYQNKNKKIYQKPYYTFSANGSGFMIRKSVGKKVGLFDRDFFSAYDDSDLCHRVWLSGYFVVYCPKAEIQHLWGATISVQNPRSWFLNDRNKISSFIKCLSFQYLVLILSSFSIVNLFWCMKNLLQGNYSRALVFPKVYWWHLVHIGQTLKKRKKVQSARKVGDLEIFKKTVVFPDWRYYLIHLGRKYNDKPLPEKFMYFQD
jgi:GT2 family glycosyltransferase